MKHIIYYPNSVISSFFKLIILISLIMTSSSHFSPNRLQAQTSTDTIRFTFESKKGHPVPGVNINYEFEELAQTPILEGQLTSDSSGILWFIQPEESLLDKMWINFTKYDDWEKGMDYGDLGLAHIALLGLDNDCPDINDHIDNNLNGSINAADLFAFRYLLLGINDTFIYDPYHFLKNGNSEDQFQVSVKFNDHFSSSTINELIAILKLDLNSNLYVTPSEDTEILDISIENKSFEVGDTMELNFTPDTSLDYRAFQFCINHEGLININTDITQYDSISSLIASTSGKPSLIAKFIAIQNGQLKDVIKLDTCQLKNEYYYGDCYEPGYLQLSIDDALHSYKSLTTEKISIYPTIAKDLIHVHMPSKHHWANWRLISYTGQEMISGKTNGSDEFTIDNLDKLSAGIYVLQLTSIDGRMAVGKFVIQ